LWLKSNRLAEIKPFVYSEDYLKFLLRCVRDVKKDSLDESHVNRLFEPIVNFLINSEKRDFISVFASQLLKLAMGLLSNGLEKDLKRLARTSLE
jgi:hypothetical protein